MDYWMACIFYCIKSALVKKTEFLFAPYLLSNYSVNHTWIISLHNIIQNKVSIVFLKYESNNFISVKLE